MSLKQKGQVSVEFLLVVGFAFLLIAGTSYFLLNFLSDTEDDISLAQANSIGNILLSHTKDAHSANGYYKKTVHLSTPEGIIDIQSENTNLIIETKMGSGTTDIVMTNDFLISTQVVPEDIYSGVFTIEKINEIPIICTGTSCTCDPIESGFIMCNDGIDNDCNGYLDSADIPCAGIPTIPPPVNNYFYGYAYSENAGYISFNSSRYWVELDGNDLKGYAYGENFGYISFQGTNYGVILNGNNLEGRAYSENLGYISFNGSNYQVTKIGNNLNSYAYSENAGYISFNGANYGVALQP